MPLYLSLPPPPPCTSKYIDLITCGTFLGELWIRASVSLFVSRQIGRSGIVLSALKACVLAATKWLVLSLTRALNTTDGSGTKRAFAVTRRRSRGPAGRPFPNPCALFCFAALQGAEVPDYGSRTKRAAADFSLFAHHVNVRKNCVVLDDNLPHMDTEEVDQNNMVALRFGSIK